jgi:predicted ribosomally synthesized peptide with nif11-like leader
MTLKEFRARLDGSDLALLQKLGACKTPDDAYAVAKAAGLTASKEDFVKEMLRFNLAVKELNENELDSVAGGRMSDGEIASTVVGAVGAVAGVAGAGVAVAVAISTAAAAASGAI